jgi:hypothetical protein
MKPFCILLTILFLAPTLLRAEATPTPTPGRVYEKPAVAEREANGFDPEGTEYRQNRLEDFQVVFVETAPFAALLSYGLTTLVSYASRGKAKMDKNTLPFFIGGTVLMASGAAYYSVSGKAYPTKTVEITLLTPVRTAWAFQGDLVRFHF